MEPLSSNEDLCPSTLKHDFQARVSVRRGTVPASEKRALCDWLITYGQPNGDL
jgi:hypothetical protein